MYRNLKLAVVTALAVAVLAGCAPNPSTPNRAALLRSVNTDHELQRRVLASVYGGSSAEGHDAYYRAMGSLRRDEVRRFAIRTMEEMIRGSRGLDWMPRSLPTSKVALARELATTLRRVHTDRGFNANVRNVIAVRWKTHGAMAKLCNQASSHDMVTQFCRPLPR